MISFFKNAEELLVSAKNLTKLPDDNLVSEILMLVHLNFSGSVKEFSKLPHQITPEMLEACFVRTFGATLMALVVTELKQLSSEAQRWFDKGGSGQE